MATINNMKMTLGERIRTQRVLMQMTQEELAEVLCIKKSTVSMYENDKVDIKGSVITELSKVLNTSPNYLLGMEEYDEYEMEILIMWKNMKDPKLKKAAVEQMRVLSNLIKCYMKNLRLSAKKSRTALTSQEDKRYTIYEKTAAIRKKIME